MAPLKGVGSLKDHACGSESRAESTCAASMKSSQSEGHSERSLGPRLAPLFKVSPPVPVGRVAGRFKVKLWRAFRTQPYGISFAVGGGGSRVTIAADTPHLGLRKGDEVTTINGQRVLSARQCNEVAEVAQDLEIQLYHREAEPSTSSESSLCGSVLSSANVETPMCCDVCLHPPESRVRASTFPMRDALLTTGPVPNTADASSALFTFQAVRMSRNVPFGIVFTAVSRSEWDAEFLAAEERCVVPSEAAPRPQGGPSSPRTTADVCGIEELFWREDSTASLDGGSCAFEEASFTGPEFVWAVKEDVPHMGLLRGDRLLRANGSPARDLEACKAAVRDSMTLVLELRRSPGLGPVLRMDELHPGGPLGWAGAPRDSPHGTGPAWLQDIVATLGLRTCLSPADHVSGEEVCARHVWKESTARTGDADASEDAILRMRS